jgi:hypothetical protein
MQTKKPVVTGFFVVQTWEKFVNLLYTFNNLMQTNNYI